MPLLALSALVGVLSLLVVMLAAVAYLALPTGRMCPRCGVPTSSILLGSWWQKPAARWLHWRWCSRCSWEGVGRRGPDVGFRDSPVDHDSGFRWRRTPSEQVPIFHWRDTPETPPDHPSGFRFSDIEEEQEEEESLGETDNLAEIPKEGTPGHVSGFRWGTPVRNTPSFMWGLGASRDPLETEAGRDQQPSVPWYLSWLPPKRPPLFRWKPKD